MFKKVIITCLIVTMAISFSSCGTRVGGNGVEKEKSIPAHNMKVQKTLEEDLNGDGSKEKIIFYERKNEQGMPVAWTIVVDGYEITALDGEEGTYTLADFKLQDVDGEDGPEVLFYRYNTGSAAAQSLNIFKLSPKGWGEIFSVRNYFNMGRDRFEMKYLGNYQVSFKDKETGFEHTIELEKSRYIGTDVMLEDISTWVDPIAEYRIDDIDGDRVNEITTVQRVIGVAHVDTIAILQTVYQLRDGVYKADKVKLTSDTGQLLAEKVFNCAVGCE